jgi:hypothetical protein
MDGANNARPRMAGPAPGTMDGCLPECPPMHHGGQIGNRVRSRSEREFTPDIFFAGSGNSRVRSRNQRMSQFGLLMLRVLQSLFAYRATQP